MPDKTRLLRYGVMGVWAVAAVIMIAYYSLWRYAAGEMESAVEDWVDDQRRAGFVVEHGSIERDGFPFFLKVRIDAPIIEQPDVFAWRADALSLHALPYELNRLIFSPAGAQFFTAKGVGAWTYSAGDIRASIANDKKRGWVFSMNIEDAVASDASGAEARLASLVYDLAPAVDDPTTLTLNLIGEGFAFQDDRRNVAIEKLENSLAVNRTDYLSGQEPAARWRNAGGAVEVYGLNASINEAILSVHGTIKLDERLRPEGVLTTALEKPMGLADALAASGALTREEADAAVAGLTLAAMAQGGSIKAPIELHAGVATIAGVKIAEIAPLR